MVNTKPASVRPKFRLFIRFSFHTGASKVSPRNISSVEHLLRQGSRQIESYEDPAVKDCWVSKEMLTWNENHKGFVQRPTWNWTFCQVLSRHFYCSNIDANKLTIRKVEALDDTVLIFCRHEQVLVSLQVTCNSINSPNYESLSHPFKRKVFTILVAGVWTQSFVHPGPTAASEWWIKCI
jgi:succinate dehydrogenase assembly factor 1